MTVQVIALLGTKLNIALRAKIIQQRTPIICMLDGDKAGYAGTSRIVRELSPFTKVGNFAIDGKDPKDMLCSEILEGLNNEFQRLSLL